MAEGDTIARAAKRMDDALAGEAVRVSAPSPRGKLAGVTRLDCRRLEEVASRGKHLLLHFEDVSRYHPRIVERAVCPADRSRRQDT